MDLAHEASRDDRKPEGRYSNYFQVGHNAFEFVLDFGQFYPKNGDPQLHTRIITSPAYIRSFLETLQQAIEGYEEKFGLIIQEQDFEDKTQP